MYIRFSLSKWGGVTLTYVFSKENLNLSSFMHTGPEYHILRLGCVGDCCLTPNQHFCQIYHDEIKLYSIG
jgi:hypothetical protein